MSKFLNVPNGNYTVTVQSGGEIRLDTGVEAGTVRVTGDLVVEGDTTTVSSENLTVKDNIIVINEGETGSSGITLQQAGIEIDRGGDAVTYTSVRMVFDETLNYRDPLTNTVKSGAFTFRDLNNALIGIRVNSISTGGGDLNLINSGTGVVRVDGTNNYEDQVTEDDILTNKKYVDDAIVSGIQNITIKNIVQGDSKVELSDDDVEAVTSNFDITINGTSVANFKENNSTIENILFEGNTISTDTSGTELILASFGTGSVTVDGILKMPEQVSDPVSVADGTLLYGKEPGLGTTGLYYVNSNDTADEVIGRNRSLLYSMIF
jgi:hypothetical protein